MSENVFVIFQDGLEIMSMVTLEWIISDEDKFIVLKH